MKILVIAAVLATGLVVSGCQTARDFFGADNPCQMAENAYSAFLVVAASSEKVSPKVRQAAATGIAAVREQCVDGDIDRFTLNKLVNAYVRGLEAYRSSER